MGGVGWGGSRGWSREPRSGACRSLRPLWVLWLGRSPLVPCRACPICSQVAGWVWRLAWWLPACVASVSEVLKAGVPHSHWGLVTKQVAERDPGAGQGAARGLATLSWASVWGLFTPRLPGFAGDGTRKDRTQALSPASGGDGAALPSGLWALPKNVHGMISTNIFLGTYHVLGTVLEAGVTSVNPTDGLSPSRVSHTRVGRDAEPVCCHHGNKAPPALCLCSSLFLNGLLLTHPTLGSWLV